MIDKSLVAYNNNRPFGVMTIIIPTEPGERGIPVENYSLLTYECSCLAASVVSDHPALQLTRNSYILQEKLAAVNGSVQILSRS